MIRNKKRGFTLIELIVCCLCFAAVSAVALPALHNQRMDIKTRQCANRVRQIALASHNYHDACRDFPAQHWRFPVK